VAGLRELVGQLKTNDPHIAGIRVTQGTGNTVRLVLALKQPIRPQVFNLEPVAAYQHRLVFDLYPLNAPDPLEQLISQRVKELDEASKRAARLLGLETGAMGNSSPPSAPAPVPDITVDPLGALIALRERPGAGAGRMPAPTVTASTPPTPPGTDRAGVGATLSANASGNPARRTVQAGRNTERLIIVALDPGHGGEDPGAIGPGGTYEKDVVLQIALRLRDRINATRVNGNPMRAYLTRDADFKPFIGRQVPAEVRNAAMKKLFTDPHYNVMDGLDIYIDDYSQPSPLSTAMMAKMVGAQFLKLVDDPNEAKPAAVAVAPASDAAAQAAPTDSDAPAQPPADTTGAESEAAPDTPTGAATAPAQPEHHDDHADLQLQPDHAPERESPGRGAG